MPLNVSLLDDAGEAAWDDFVTRAPGGTFFHLAPWRRVMRQAFGHRTYYLQAQRDGRIVGVLPLTHVKSFLFGNALISAAFCVQGGVVAQDDAAADALEAECLRIARDLKVDCVEFRSSRPGRAGWLAKSGIYVSFRKPILPDSEQNMKAIPRKQRAMVRKGISNGLVSEIDAGVDRLHHVYAQSVRNLGTPVFSKRYFALLKEAFPGSSDVVTVLHQGRPVASVLNFYFRGEVLPYYGGSVSEGRALAANDFMYWEVMRRAGEMGCNSFDFGRSKVGTGAYNFKHYWGFEPQPLVYEFYPVAKPSIPDVSPLNPKYQPFIALWRHMPLALTKLVGPPIVRNIG